MKIAGLRWGVYLLLPFFDDLLLYLFGLAHERLKVDSSCIFIFLSNFLKPLGFNRDVVVVLVVGLLLGM